MKILHPAIRLVARIPLMDRITKWALNLISYVPLLNDLVNRIAVNYIASRTVARPRPFSLWYKLSEPASSDAPGPISDYTSWFSLTNKKFSGRHLPPARQAFTDSLPPDAPYDPKTGRTGNVTGLFARQGDGKKDRSTVLFAFFAQWFTDSILRVDPLDRRKNTSNHDIDLCQIYGLDEATSRLLRTMNGGKLRSQQIGGDEFLDYLCEPDGAGGFKVKSAYDGLPYSHMLDVLLAGFPPDRKEKLYATGLERGNSSVGYVAISTIFMREHNRICDELKRRNPAWNDDDERLFQTARMINIVVLLKLVVEDYINHISGHRLFHIDTTFAEQQNWYRTNWIAIEFDLLYRWHGLVPDKLAVNGTDYPAPQFRNNNALLEQAGVSAIIDAVSSQAAGKIGLFNTPDFLWGAEYASIKMSRDFRLRSFNDYREHFGLPRMKGFRDLTKDVNLRQTLEKLYGGIDRLEYVVGLFAEDPGPGMLFGDLLNAMVAYDAFTQIYTNPLLSQNIYNADTLTDYGLELIDATTSIQVLVGRNVAPGSHPRASLGI